MRNIYERVSDGKLQIAILIPRRGPCLIRSSWSSGAESLGTWEALDQFSAPAILLQNILCFMLCSARYAMWLCPYSSQQFFGWWQNLSDKSQWLNQGKFMQTNFYDIFWGSGLCKVSSLNWPYLSTAEEEVKTVIHRSCEANKIIQFWKIANNLLLLKKSNGHCPYLFENQLHSAD